VQANSVRGRNAQVAGYTSQTPHHNHEQRRFKERERGLSHAPAGESAIFDAKLTHRTLDERMKKKERESRQKYKFSQTKKGRLTEQERNPVLDAQKRKPREKVKAETPPFSQPDTQQPPYSSNSLPRCRARPNSRLSPPIPPALSKA